jgi:hypothetical protein
MKYLYLFSEVNMNIKNFTIFLLIAVLVIFGFNSCFPNNEPNIISNSKNSFNWEGVYTGSFLTDSGNVQDVCIKLNKDQSFEANYQYIDGSYNSINMRGRFRWDDTESIIMIDVIDAPIQYKIAKDKMIRLDVYGYVLEKIN